MGYEITDADMGGVDASGKVAIMESLILAVMAEGQRPPGEIANFDKETERIPWGMDADKLSTDMHAARDRIKALDGDEAVAAFIGTIAQRVTEPSLREKVWRAAAFIAADSGLSNQEKNYLILLANAFEMSVDQIKEIKADVKEEIG
jgi:hypothetical protein